jgi:CRP-like cAMP-binding protein
VADVLVHLHEEAPEVGIHLSRDDMAALVGMASESLIRTLSEFRQSGFIEVLPNTIRVVHLDKLS